MTEQEAIARLKQMEFDANANSIGVVSMDGRHKEINMAIEALKFQQEHQDKEFEINGIMHFVEKFMTKEEMKGKDNVQKADFMREKVLKIMEQSEYEYEAKVQKCIDRLEENFKYKCEWKNECLKEMKEIIKEEMGVKE